MRRAVVTLIEALLLRRTAPRGASRAIVAGVALLSSCRPAHSPLSAPAAPPPAGAALPSSPPASAAFPSALPPGAPRAEAPPPEASAAAPAPSPEADDAFALMRGESVGPVACGMPERDLRRLVGEPRRRGPRALEGATGLYVETWSFPSGLSVKMSAEDAAGPWRVSDVFVRRPSKLRTRRGVGVGASAELVRARYAGHLDDASSGAERLVAGSVYGGLIFRLRGGIVESIFLGAAAE
jgi:hypothetical protein